ncbi:MAG TPA: glycosyltransferase [Vicinamibacteria bacterium]
MSTPVGVLHVCDKFGVRGSSIHGVSRLFSWWFPRFDASRFAVSLVGLKAPEPASRLLEEQGIPVTHLGRGPFDPRILPDLVALVRARRIRVLHVHGYASANFGRLAARATGAALVLHEHFADPNMPGYQGLADRLLARWTDRAVAVSGSTRDFLVLERHVEPARVRVIWNGAPLAEFAPVSPEQAARTRASLGLSPQAVVIGAIGRLSEQKGHRYLIEAAPEVIRQHEDARFLIVGDGNLLEPLRAQARALGIGDKVIFAGHRSDVRDLLGAIDVVCLPSLYEGTPLALFEAMAAARAIVASAVDGCAEILEDGATGLLVPPRDAPALGAALRRILAERSLLGRLGAAAQQASREYDIDRTVRRLEELYVEVLGERTLSHAA